MNLRQIQQACAKRTKECFPQCADWTLGDWGCALAGEVGETCNLLKKARRGGPLKTAEIADELADVLSYVALLADRLNIDLQRAFRKKFNEVSAKIGSKVKLPIPLDYLGYPDNLQSLVVEATARGWCTPKNSGKIMDVDLALAIADEVCLALTT